MSDKIQYKWPTREELIELIPTCKSLQELADKLGKTKGNLSVKLNSLGLKTGYPRSRPKGINRPKSISLKSTPRKSKYNWPSNSDLKLLCTTHSLTDLSVKLGIPKASLYQRLHSLGYKARPEDKYRQYKQVRNPETVDPIKTPPSTEPVSNGEVKPKWSPDAKGETVEEFLARGGVIKVEDKKEANPFRPRRACDNLR